MSICVNFSKLWSQSLNQKYSIYKNQKAQFLTNQIMKDKIKKKLILKNDPKQKIGIKRMRTKFEKKKERTI